MSELRRLLRYEIPGLAIIIHVVLVSFIFLSFDECIELIKYLGKFAAAIALLSLFVGWLAIQVFEDRCHPHRETMGFNRIHELIQKNFKLKDYECCFATIDYLLKDDMYVNYPGLADTLRGYWDQYYARCIIGAGVPLLSFLTFIILAVLEQANIICCLYVLCPCDIAIRFSSITYCIFIYQKLLTLSITEIFLRVIYTAFLILYNLELYLMFWDKSDRIFKEIELQEYLFISDNIYKLNGIKFDSFLKDYLDRRKSSSTYTRCSNKRIPP